MMVSLLIKYRKLINQQWKFKEPSECDGVDNEKDCTQIDSPIFYCVMVIPYI